MEVDENTLSSEEYVIQRAKLALEDDPLSAKAWMITAKTLYPNNFGVQFEAYQIEKNAGRVKEAAKCFSDLISKFQQHPQFWVEINNLTSALRVDIESADSDKRFLCDMFTHISLDVQHKLLLLTADHCEDTMEHCKLLLLLLQKFPTAIPTHGPGLIDTLLSAEKHSHAGNQPINPYRKLLVYDLLPLLNIQASLCNYTLELSSKLLYKLMHKATEYHFANLAAGIQSRNLSDSASNQEIWSKLFTVVEFVGKHLGWEPYLTNFTKKNWSKENYWQKLMIFCQSQSLNLEDQNILKQLVYCLTLFLVFCLNHYTMSMNPEPSPGHPAASYVLVDAFVDPNLPSINPDHRGTKRRKSETDLQTPLITLEKPELKNITTNFIMAVNCWDLLHSSEPLNREFVRVSNHLKLDNWLNGFLVDYLIYKERHDDALNRLYNVCDSFHTPLIKSLRIASLLYLKGNYLVAYEHILSAISLLPPQFPSATPAVVAPLTVGGAAVRRHLHFLPLTCAASLRYCARILIRSIREAQRQLNASGNTSVLSDAAIGNLLVLVQLDWPLDEELIPQLLEQVVRRGMFHYYLFQNYIVQVDILEEFAYLWSPQGGSINLDIVPHLGQRRIGTRGADKGVKEEVKQAIRRQIQRCNEPVHQLIATFIDRERSYITKAFMQ